MAIRQEMRNSTYLLYLFLVGVFLGILCVNIKYDFWIKEDGLLNTAMLEQLANCELNGSYLMGYILRHRLTEITVVGILALTMLGIPVVCGYIGYLGLSAGCLLSVAVIRYGIRGLFLIAAGIFPQILFLLPGYLLLFSMGMECSRTFYHRNAERTGWLISEKQFLLKCLGKALEILIFVLVGCILECYVNPQILHFALKLF